MCCHQVRGWATAWGGVRPQCRLPGDGRLGCFHGSTDVGSTLFFFSFLFFFLIPQSSEGLHTVSSRDNGVPSVATVRITEHNGGRAAVMPARGRPTGSSCSRLSSDGSRVFLATCDLLPAATSACFAHVGPPREQKSVFLTGTINISTTNLCPVAPF